MGRRWGSPLGLIPEKEIQNEIHICFVPLPDLWMNKTVDFTERRKTFEFVFLAMLETGESGLLRSNPNFNLTAITDLNDTYEVNTLLMMMKADAELF